MEPISKIDQNKGMLYFRGREASELAVSESFESALHLLMYGYIPEKKKLADFVTRLKSLRRDIESNWNAEFYFEETKEIPVILSDFPYYAQLEFLDKLYCFMLILPKAISSNWKERSGSTENYPKSNIGHASHIYNLLSKNPPSPEDLRDFETCLILHMDDPDNPSLSALKENFRKTRDVSYALQSALIRHNHPLHHGAGYEAYKMIVEASDSKSVEIFLRRRLEQGKKIFGLGHRIYQTIDPRARVLANILESRTKATENYWLFETIKEIAQVGAELLLNSKGIEVHPNLDLYNAAVYSTLGIEPELNTELFAMSRAAGWAAHLNEMFLS